MKIEEDIREVPQNWKLVLNHYYGLAAEGKDVLPIFELFDYLLRNGRLDGCHPLSFSHCVSFSRTSSYEVSRTMPSVAVQYLGNRRFRVFYVEAETKGFSEKRYDCSEAEVYGLVESMTLRLEIDERSRKQPDSNL